MPARFQKLHSIFGKPFAVVVFGLGKRSANVEHMNSSNAFKIVRILDKCLPCKIVGKVDYIFQSVINLQLIARQHSEELIALRTYRPYIYRDNSARPDLLRNLQALTARKAQSR